MHPRLNIANAAPELFRAVYALETAVRGAGLDASHLHLLKLRASQINGCAYCVDMHVKESLRDGLDPQKLHLVAAWRESPLFDDKERAVLDWTESVTLLADTGVPDDAYARVRAVFSEAEVARLTVAIGVINVWNRLAVSARTPHPIGAEIASG